MTEMYDKLQMLNLIQTSIKRVQILIDEFLKQKEGHECAELLLATKRQLDEHMANVVKDITDRTLQDDVREFMKEGMLQKAKLVGRASRYDADLG